MAGDITGRHLKKVADLIGDNWMDLGIKLNLSYNELRILANPAGSGPTQFASRMLNTWHAENANMTASQVRETVVEALEEAHRNDVAAEVRGNLRSDSDIQRVFQDISGKLIRDWKTVGLYLDIPSHKLDAACKSPGIEEDPREQMLEKWHQRTAKDDQRNQLIPALRELCREDIVKALEEVDSKIRSRNRRLETSRPSSSQPSDSRREPSVAKACTFFDQQDLSQVPHDNGARPQSGHRPDMAHAIDGGQQAPLGVLSDATTSSLFGSPPPEQEVDDAPMLHDPPSVSDKTSERLNPHFEWMGSDFRRLRDAINTPISRPVVIALLDSGVNLSHPDLKDLIVRSENFIGVKRHGQLIPNQEEEGDLMRDFLNHGTVSAGILRQYAGNKNVKILNLKVKSDSAGNLRYVSRALAYIKKWDKENQTMPVDIVVMSLGHPKDDAETNRCLADLGEYKVLVCSAANEGQRRADSILSPAKHGSVIAVGSCNKFGNRCDHSAVGGQLAFLFPGTDIWSTSSKYTPPNESTRYINREGTSFAAPHCGALVAVLLPFIEKELHNFRGKSGAEWRRILTNSSKMKELIRDFCHREHSYDKGYGAPELNLITKNRIEDFIGRNF